jgi:hypothetical protein
MPSNEFSNYPWHEVLDQFDRTISSRPWSLIRKTMKKRTTVLSSDKMCALKPRGSTGYHRSTSAARGGRTASVQSDLFILCENL